MPNIIEITSFSDPRLDAVVHSGDVRTMEFPYMEKVIGTSVIPAPHPELWEQL